MYTNHIYNVPCPIFTSRFLYHFNHYNIYILYIHHLVYIPTNVGCDFLPIVVLVPPIRTGCISGVRGEPSAPGLSPCAAFRTRSVLTNRVRPLSTWTHSGRCGPMTTTTKSTAKKTTTKAIINNVDGVRVY